MPNDDHSDIPDDPQNPGEGDPGDGATPDPQQPVDPNAQVPPAAGADPAGQFTQRVRHQQVSALVPEDIARGVFSTGALVLNGPHEFVVDFLQAMTRPQQVAARVILPPTIMANMVRALKQNIENFEKRFGELPAIPKPLDAPDKPPTPPTIEEIYDQLKLPEDVASGTYANTVLITHSPTEFCLDFITSFYPKSAVSVRIFMAVPQISRLAETLNRSWEQYQAKVRAQREALAAQAAQQRVLRTPEEIAQIQTGAPLAPDQQTPQSTPTEQSPDAKADGDDTNDAGNDASRNTPSAEAPPDDKPDSVDNDTDDTDDRDDDDRKADDAA